MKTFNVKTQDQEEKNDIINVVCLYYAQLNSSDPRYKDNYFNDFSLVAECFGYKYNSIKNRRDAYDALFPNNGRKGWHQKEYGIAKKPILFKSYQKFKDLPLLELESAVKQIITDIKAMLDAKVGLGVCGSLAASGTSGEALAHTPFPITKVINVIKDLAKLKYDDFLIKRFAYSLMAKPFVILSGLAGSGKTQLALAFARSLAENSDGRCPESQVRIVPVGADWTNREPLLGYPNALKQAEYIRPESKVLEFLQAANHNQQKPYFLILDEMNMSYVERYFSDFLSVMESGEEIQLWDNPEGAKFPPGSIKVPKNVYIIGTINVDETTYMFSPKVLDRANVIEFKISESEMSDFLGNLEEVSPMAVCGQAKDVAELFVNCSGKINRDPHASSILTSFFKQLKSVNAEFGYRSANEIFRYIYVAKNNDDPAKPLTEEQILDSAIVQKLLPKLHGSRKKLAPVLNELWKLCFKSGLTEENHKLEKVKEVPKDVVKYPLTADKVLRMYRCAVDNGFTSFAEA